MVNNPLRYLANHFVSVLQELRSQVVTKRFWIDVLVVFIGVCFYAIGFSFLIYPQRITTGGLTGFCNLFTLTFGIGVDVPYNIINYFLLLLAFLFLNKNFFIKTLIGIFFIGLILKYTTHWAVPNPADIESFKLMVLQDQPVLDLVWYSLSMVARAVLM